MKEDIGISKPKKHWNKIRIVFKQQNYVVMWKWCFDIVDKVPSHSCSSASSVLISLHPLSFLK